MINFLKEDFSMFTEEKIKELDEEYAGYIESLPHQNVEGAHIQADEYLVSLLKELGFEKTVEEFESMHKWYA